MPKSRALVKSAALPHIVECILSVMPLSEIYKMTKSRYRVSDKTVQRWIGDARRYIAKTRPMPDTGTLIAEHISRLETLYAQAETPRDRLDILRDIAKVSGLYVDRHETVVRRIDSIDDRTLLTVLVDRPIDHRPIDHRSMSIDHSSGPQVPGVGGNGTEGDNNRPLTKSGDFSTSSTEITEADDLSADTDDDAMGDTDYRGEDD